VEILVGTDPDFAKQSVPRPSESLGSGNFLASEKVDTEPSAQGLLISPKCFRQLLWQQIAFVWHEAATREIGADHDWLIGTNLDREGNIRRRIGTCYRHCPG